MAADADVVHPVPDDCESVATVVTVLSVRFLSRYVSVPAPLRSECAVNEMTRAPTGRRTAPSSSVVAANVQTPSPRMPSPNEPARCTKSQAARSNSIVPCLWRPDPATVTCCPLAPVSPAEAVMRPPAVTVLVVVREVSVGVGEADSTPVVDICTHELLEAGTAAGNVTS